MYEVIPQNLSILAMRNSGYRDTDYAIAELIDNSIQAGLGTKHIDIEIICIDKLETKVSRQTREIDKVLAYDNSSGMDEETLRMALQFGNGTHLEAKDQKGIGKFGMGLPNSSISQCRQVDVWTWQSGKTIHSYLNIDEIAKGQIKEVPKPKNLIFPKSTSN